MLLRKAKRRLGDAMGKILDSRTMFAVPLSLARNLLLSLHTSQLRPSFDLSPGIYA